MADNPNINYKCRICGKVLGTSGGIRIHIHRKHQESGTAAKIEETREPSTGRTRRKGQLVSPEPALEHPRVINTNRTMYRCSICGREGVARSTQVHIIQGHGMRNWKEHCKETGAMAAPVSEPVREKRKYTKRPKRVPFATATTVECQVTLEIPLVIGAAVLKELKI